MLGRSSGRREVVEQEGGGHREEHLAGAATARARTGTSRSSCESVSLGMAPTGRRIGSGRRPPWVILGEGDRTDMWAPHFITSSVPFKQTVFTFSATWT